MNKKLPWIIAGVLAVVLIGGGTWYYKTKHTTTAPSYMFGTVKRGNVAKKINATGTIQYPTQYNLTFDGKSRLTAVNVSVGDTVKAGQDLAEVDSSAANQQVLQAKASLAQAQLKLNQLKAGSTQVQILQAQDSLAKAQASLANAQQNLSTLQSYKDPNVLQNAIDANQGYGQNGGSSLQGYKSNPASLDVAIQQAQNTLNSAQADYNVAKAQLDSVNAGSSSSDIQSAQLQVEQAQASLDTAQAALNQTKLIAPADGMITAVNGKVGEYPSTGGSGTGSNSSGAFIVLNGTSNSMQIVVPADEADIGSVKAGQAVDITLPAFPDKHFNGSVAQVSPVGTTSNNVTTFSVTISADNSENLMMAGMSANVAILIEQKQNVLMVPSEAVHGTGANATILLPPAAGSTRPQSVSVQIGLDDGTNAEVISGLDEGQQVITGFRVQKSTTGTQSGNPLSGGNRSGFGGMGGFGGGAGGGYARGGSGGSGGGSRGN